jgi:hypothetical protein
MLALFQNLHSDHRTIGDPVSGWIMSFMGGQLHLANWQWVFLLEGIPSIVVGLVGLPSLMGRMRASV